MHIQLTDHIQPNAVEGCIYVNESTIPVTVVAVKGRKEVTRRKTGMLGDYLDELSLAFKNDEWVFKRLMRGETVTI